MGIGFWVIQAVFLIGAVATAAHAELERRRQPQGSRRQVPVEHATRFSIVEEARLLRLRGSVREARASHGRLYDDLVPDPDKADAGHSSWQQLKAGGWMVLAGVMLFGVGAFGMWQTTINMDALESAGSAAPRMSVVARVVPGPIVNPARYLTAVNSSGASSISIEASALLAQKQAMDRYVAVVGLSLALLLASFAPPRRAGDTQSSVAGDLVPFVVVAALVCAGLSLFELPPPL